MKKLKILKLSPDSRYLQKLALNMYLEKGMNVVFHHHPNAIFFYLLQFLHILLMYCLYSLYVIQRVG